MHSHDCLRTSSFDSLMMMMDLMCIWRAGGKMKNRLQTINSKGKKNNDHASWKLNIMGEWCKTASRVWHSAEPMRMRCVLSNALFLFFLCFCTFLYCLSGNFIATKCTSSKKFWIMLSLFIFSPWLTLRCNWKLQKA